MAVLATIHKFSELVWGSWYSTDLWQTAFPVFFPKQTFIMMNNKAATNRNTRINRSIPHTSRLRLFFVTGTSAGSKLLKASM